MWPDDAYISWMLRSKSWTQQKEGSTVLFVAELATGKINYKELLSYIEENINIGD